jgi:putative ABC transport system permease protein
MKHLRRSFYELLESLRIAGGALAGNRMRTFLTTLGIVIGVMTVIAIIAIIQGLNESVAKQVGSLGANTLYVSNRPWIMTGEDWWQYRNRKKITRKELAAVMRESSVATAAAPLGFEMATVTRADKEVGNVQITGTNEQYTTTNGGNITAGRFLVEGDVELARFSAVIGADVADQLFPKMKPDDIVGQRIRVGPRNFTIVGTLERRGRFMGMPMDNVTIVPFTTFSRVFGAKRNFNIAVTAATEDLMALEDELVSILRKARMVPAGQPDDFAINRQEQFLSLYKKLTGALYGVAIGVGLITLVVGGIGIMNIMLVSVRERTREIGVRRALGARKRTIVTQFLIESLAVAAAGGIVGTGLGLAVAKLVAEVSPLAAAVTPSAIALGIAFSSLVGLLFGSWPAWQAASIDPVEALRYE